MANILPDHGESYAEAILQLEVDLKLGLDETNCPWLDQEQCCIQSIRNVLNCTDLRGPTPDYSGIFSFEYDIPAPSHREPFMYEFGYKVRDLTFRHV